MKKIHWLLLLLVMGACKDRYNAPVHIPPTGYLVVEGFINVGIGSTDVTLSRATGLDSPYVRPEGNAQVSVEAENGTSYQLTDTGNAHYTVSQIPVDLGQKYRLRIVTSLGGEYLSDFTAPIVTPDIDSVSWKAGDDGVRIFVSTHGSLSDPRYFQWQFNETWIYTSAYPSPFIYQEYGQMIHRPDPYEIYTCWSTNQSSEIEIASTTRLSANEVSLFPITFVSYSTSNRLTSKYSILVRQQALSADWYAWKQKIQKNTEQLGSIFDAQPSEITGNIHNTKDPNEPVIGFVGCTTEVQRRIFISRIELPFVPIYNPYSDCAKIDTISKDPDSVARYFRGGYHLAIDEVYKGPEFFGYAGSTVGCVNCRALGGTTNKPDFWP